MYKKKFQYYNFNFHYCFICIVSCYTIDCCECENCYDCCDDGDCSNDG